jgi:hypothetical protein
MRPTRAFRAPFLVVLIGFLLRLAVLLLAKPFRLSPDHDYFAFAGEAAHIARALVTGYGYADPFWGHTGPTAWVPPGHPLLIAALFKVFGVFTDRAALALFLIQCAAQAWVARFVWEIAARSFDPPLPDSDPALPSAPPRFTPSLIAAWFWALYPGFFQYSVWWAWETGISTFLFTWALVVALRIRRVGEPSTASVTASASISGDSPRFVTDTASIPLESPASVTDSASIPATPWSLWLLFGLLWGIIALYNPSLLLFLPVVGIWLLRDPASTVSAQLRPAAVAALLCLALFTPWMLRNYRVFHHFIPARSNLGVELCVGNCRGINGVLGVIDQPAVSPPEFAHYVRSGEYQYTRDKMAEFKAAVRRSPAKFLGLCLLRADLYWFGVPGRYLNPLKDAARLLAFAPFAVSGIWGVLLAYRRRRPAAGLYLLALAIVPLPYYFAIVLARFRHPIEPILIAASAYLLCSAQRSWRVRPFTRL